MSDLFSNIDYDKFYNEIHSGIGEVETLKNEIRDNKEDNLDIDKEKKAEKKLKKEIQKRNQKEK